MRYIDKLVRDMCSVVVLCVQLNEDNCRLCQPCGNKSIVVLQGEYHPVGLGSWHNQNDSVIRNFLRFLRF